MQFIPIVERIDDTERLTVPGLDDSEQAWQLRSPQWSTDAKTFGRFLGDIYDEWSQMMSVIFLFRCLNCS